MYHQVIAMKQHTHTLHILHTLHKGHTLHTTPTLHTLHKDHTLRITSTPHTIHILHKGHPPLTRRGTAKQLLLTVPMHTNVPHTKTLCTKQLFIHRDRMLFRPPTLTPSPIMRTALLKMCLKWTRTPLLPNVYLKCVHTPLLHTRLLRRMTVTANQGPNVRTLYF